MLMKQFLEQQKKGINPSFTDCNAENDTGKPKEEIIRKFISKYLLFLL